MFQSCWPHPHLINLVCSILHQLLFIKLVGNHDICSQHGVTSIAETCADGISLAKLGLDKVLPEGGAKEGILFGPEFLNHMTLRFIFEKAFLVVILQREEHLQDQWIFL